MQTTLLEMARSLHSHRHTLVLPEMQLSYWQWGTTGGEPVLLLHGLADHGGVWLTLADYLANHPQRHYHVIAPDLRGHGDSSKPQQGYTCHDIIADLTALMQHLGWSSAHIVAHSWAAKVATVWAQQTPQVCRSLTLIDPFFIEQMPSWLALTFPVLYRILPFLKTMGPFGSYEQAEQVAQHLKQYQGWSDRQQLAFYLGMEKKPDGRWGSKFVVQARDQIFADVMQVAGLTEAIAIPTLFVQPQKGLNRTDWQLRPYRTYLTQLQIQQVPGHHWCFLVEPDAFNQAIASFLATQG